MFNPDDRPPGAIAEDAYDILVETVDPEDGMPREEAHTELLEKNLSIVTPNTPLIACVAAGICMQSKASCSSPSTNSMMMSNGDDAHNGHPSCLGLLPDIAPQAGLTANRTLYSLLSQ